MLYDTKVKPKILIFQESGMRSDNYCFRESLCLQRAFARLGVQSGVVGRGYSTLNTNENNYDALVFLENYNLDGIDLTNFKKPKLFWSIDGHCNYERHLEFAKKNEIDLVLSSCKDVTKKYIKDGLKSVWFPNCYSSDLIGYCDLKSIDFGYVGSKGNEERQKYLTELNVHAMLDLYIDVIGGEMARLLSSFMVGFNRNLSDDINYRTFETMGAGTLLMTNETPGLFNIIPNDLIVTYNSIDDCINKYQRLMMDKKDCIIRGFKAYKYVREHHTYDKRSEKILNILERGV